MAEKEMLTEERVRQIVREELEAWEKRQVQRARFGTPMSAEVKSPPKPRVDDKLIGKDC